MTDVSSNPYAKVSDAIEASIAAAEDDYGAAMPGLGADDGGATVFKTAAEVKAIAAARAAATPWLVALKAVAQTRDEIKALVARLDGARRALSGFSGVSPKTMGRRRYRQFQRAQAFLKRVEKALAKARASLPTLQGIAEKRRATFKKAFAKTGLTRALDLWKTFAEEAKKSPDSPALPEGWEPSDWGYDVTALNSNYALVLMGSKAVVVREQPDAAVEDRVRILSMEAFVAYHANRFCQYIDSKGDLKTISWGKRWLADKVRRTYDGIEFRPDPKNEGGQDSHLNLWRGFSVVPDAKAGTYATFRDHMITNVCNGDAALYAWIFGWFAHLIQRPRERVGTALVFKGKMGTGKTKIGEVFGSLIENHYFLVDEPRYITGQFNAHMASCLLLQAEEAVWAGDKTAEGRLKSLITSKIQMIESKGVDPIRLTNYVRLVMTSNEDWVVPAGMDERRFAVFDISSGVKGNFEYFKEMDAQLDAGGRAALLADLLAFDLSSVELRDIPKTSALLEQKIRSLGHVEYWWFERLRMGTQRAHTTHWFPEVSKSDLISDYLNQAEKIGIRRRSGEVEVGMKLSRLVPGLGEARRWMDVTDDDGRTHRAQKRCWLFPSLDVCRAAFEDAVQQPVQWPTDNEFEADGGGADE